MPAGAAEFARYVRNSASPSLPLAELSRLGVGWGGNFCNFRWEGPVPGGDLPFDVIMNPGADETGKGITAQNLSVTENH